MQIVIGQKINFPEDLERVDDGQDRHEQHRRRQVPELDVEKLIDLRRTLDLRNLQKLLGNVVERRHK